MVGVTEIGAAISGLKGAMDIAKGLNATAGAVAINEAKISLQATILDAQTSLLSAQELQNAQLKKIDQLEKEIAKLASWEKEKERYQLREFPTGALAYMLKEDDSSDEPSHRICPQCFQEGHKAILQTTVKRSGGEKVECPRCKLELKLAEFPHARVEYSRTVV